LTKINCTLPPIGMSLRVAVQGMPHVQSLRQDLIRRAYDIIRDPACWTRSGAARDELSRPISPISSDARVLRLWRALEGAPRARAPRALGRTDFDTPALTHHQNDAKGHADVLALLRSMADDS